MNKIPTSPDTIIPINGIIFDTGLLPPADGHLPLRQFPYDIGYPAGCHQSAARGVCTALAAGQPG